MFETGLFALLAGNAVLNAQIQGRLSPVHLPEKSPLPAMTYWEVGGNATPTFETSGMQRVRMEFDAFGDTFLAAAQARDALRLVLDGYSGVLSDGTILQSAQRIANLPSVYLQDARQYKCPVEYYLMFNFTP